MSKKLPVVELFGPTIQGEGALIGMRSHFLRLGGCPYRCTWCDSLHAVIPEQIKQHARYLTPTEITAEIKQLQNSPALTLTGGDPVMWDLTELIALLKDYYLIAVETEGALWKDWLEQCDYVTVSPKPPSSGMADKLDMEMLRKYCSLPSDKTFFKIVIFDDVDYEWAMELYKHICCNVRLSNFYFSAGTEKIDSSQYATQESYTDGVRLRICNRLLWLSDKMVADPDAELIKVLPQQHVLTWGTSLGR